MVYSSDLDQLAKEFTVKEDWESHFAALTLRHIQDLYKHLDIDANEYEMNRIKRKGIFLALKEYLAVETDFGQ